MTHVKEDCSKHANVVSSNSFTLLLEPVPKLESAKIVERSTTFDWRAAEPDIFSGVRFIARSLRLMLLRLRLAFLLLCKYIAY